MTTLTPDSAESEVRLYRDKLLPHAVSLRLITRIPRMIGKMSGIFFKEIVMKKLALLALSVIATAAMAAGEIDISGTSIQIAAIHTSGVSNTANGQDSVAQQNLASNAGDIDIKGTSVQVVAAKGSYISNWADRDTLAQQNLSSNVGDVDITGTSVQVTALYNSYVGNRATGDDALAVQNIASNNSCFGCPKPENGGGHNN